MGYVFFDTETTGLAGGFDQIVQFAAIRTDHDLNEIDRINERARLQPHVVPHPAALRANGLTIAELTDPHLQTHYEMVCKIQRQLRSWSPSIFAGFNSIGFDEEMLRHALFQSLHPAYLTSNHQNGRADAFGLVQAACATTPGCLVLPHRPDGRPSFKLDKLAPANGVKHEGAHDAMADVLATIELCRLVKDRCDVAWQRFAQFSNKAVVADLIESESAFLLTEFFGGEPYHRVVTCVGEDPRNRNGRFCVDLSIDPDAWRAMSDEELQQALARKGSPIRRVRTNRAPTITLLCDAETYLPEGVDIALSEHRGSQIQSDVNLCKRLIESYAASWKDAEQSPHPELCLYSGGFPNDADAARCLDFHDANWRRRSEIVARFDDPRLKAFGQRLIYSEHRSLLSPAERLAVDFALAETLLIPNGGPLTLPGALGDTNALIADGLGDPSGNLSGFRDHLIARIARVEAFRAR